MPEAKILITGDAKGAIAATKDVTTAMGDMQKGMKDAGGAAKEHSEKVEFLNLKMGELKKLTRELGNEFPIAGMAIRAMLNPTVFAITTAIALFGALKGKLEEWNKAMEESEKRNANKDFLPGIEAKREAMIEGAAAAARFNESMKALAMGEDSFSTKVKTAVDRLHEFVAAQAEVRSASEAYELSRVNLQEKLGKITPEQAILQRGGIKTRYERQADEAKTHAENQELGLKESEANERKARQEALDADARAKAQQATKLKANLAELQKNLPNQELRLEENNQEAIKRSLEVERVREFRKNFNASSGEVEEAQTASQAAETALKNRQHFIASMRAQITTIDSSLLPHAESEHEEAENKAKSNQDRINALEQEINNLHETLPIRQRARSQVALLRSSTETMDMAGELSGTPLGQTAIGAAAGENALAHGGQPSLVQGSQIAALQQMTTGRDRNGDAVLNAIGRLHIQEDATGRAMVEAIQRLADRQKTLEEQVRGHARP